METDFKVMCESFLRDEMWCKVIGSRLITNHSDSYSVWASEYDNYCYLSGWVPAYFQFLYRYVVARE